MALGQPRRPLPQIATYPSSTSSAGDLKIWLDEDTPPTPPPKTPNTMTKFASFSTPRHSGLPPSSTPTPARLSDSTTDEYGTAVSYSPEPAMRTHDSLGSTGGPLFAAGPPSQPNGTGVLRKTKSAVNSFLRRSKSKPRLFDAAQDQQPATPPMPLDHPQAAHHHADSSFRPFRKSDRKRTKEYSQSASTGSVNEDGEGTKYEFDLDLREMDGIIDTSRLPPGPPVPAPGDPLDDVDPGLISISAPFAPVHASPPTFSDPFMTSAGSTSVIAAAAASASGVASSSIGNGISMSGGSVGGGSVHGGLNGMSGLALSSSGGIIPGRRGATLPQSLHDLRRLSPRTVVPPEPKKHQPAVVPEQLVQPATMIDGVWQPPESWNVDAQDESLCGPDSDTDEGESGVETSLRALEGSHQCLPNGPGIPMSVSTSGGRRRSTDRRSRMPSKPKTYKLRIHFSATDFRVLSLGLNVQVANVCRYLNRELLGRGEHETYRLYLKERGRERVLANTERPADIVRRRLEQAGYTTADGLDELGAESLSFLLKFVYKSNVLGPTEEDLVITNYSYVDLTNKGLRTIPIALYGRAEDISSLDLSRNPMLEIPLDFIQSCTTLRELRLSNMAIKKVPNSVRDCVTLYALDISCNRIMDLNDSGLDRIPELTHLYAQNNRMETLPWYFPRLGGLRTLNISNNKFQTFPAVVCKMPGLIVLDISFNMITELPDDIGRISSLERLVMVGNRVAQFPNGIKNLTSLRILDCRRNNITDIGVVCMLPMLEEFYVDHNAIHAVDLTAGQYVRTIDMSHNDVTRLSLLPGPIGHAPVALTSLNLSYAKLSSLDELDLSDFTSLESLSLDHNSFRKLPPTLGCLSRLTSFSCADNLLEELPVDIGQLQNLERLDMHNNNLSEIPSSIWTCGALRRINMTSNVISIWHPPVQTPIANVSSGTILGGIGSDNGSLLSLPAQQERKVSTVSSIGTSFITSSRAQPPLVFSLEGLYLGENNLSDESLPVLMILRGLRVLNLSFNNIQEMPRSFFRDMTRLEEFYVSGNKLASLPTEDLHRLQQLRVLFLNGNRLHTLPRELSKVAQLTMLDVGSNQLKYNINNWEFDWNWNFNPNLRYLNLSGNKRLEIKPDTSRKVELSKVIEDLAGFVGLQQLRVLGLMDVTTTFTNHIPEEAEDRRVRTSLSEVNNMQYGIADNLGDPEFVSMFDLVIPNFRDRQDEALFAMFGRARAPAANSPIAKYLHDNFAPVFTDALANLDANRESIPDALRRAFLKLNWITHDYLFSGGAVNAAPLPAGAGRKMSSASASILPPGDTSGIGASGVVAFIMGRMLYVANTGSALAVVCRRGHAEPVSAKHDPFNRGEIERIRAAEGWVSPKGLVNDEVSVSRSFGFYHLVPVLNAKPDIFSYELTDSDEFIIIANSGLWDYVSFQTAIDIARTEKNDPMIAAQKLRDFAISYGAEGTTMIMVISTPAAVQARSENLAEVDAFVRPLKRKEHDTRLARLPTENPPPSGHLALVFTDIRNSTVLWDTNAGMQSAIRMHHDLLRRELRVCGGYEVKTEGDAFMVTFQNVSTALLWCLTVQTRLLEEQWPREILDSTEGRELKDANGNVVARGLSVRMGIHCGMPVCEKDITTQRMDYYGPMVNRAARVMGSAAGGQIMVTADVVREIEASVLRTGPETERTFAQPIDVIEEVRGFNIQLLTVGEVKLRGIEIPETLTLVYPEKLLGRHYLDTETYNDPTIALTDPPASSTTSSDDSLPQAICTPEQIRELAAIAIRLQMLAGGRIFRPIAQRKGSAATVTSVATASANAALHDTSTPETPTSKDAESLFVYADPSLLLPMVPDRVSESELLGILEYVLVSLETSVDALVTRFGFPELDALVRAVQSRAAKLDRASVARLLEALTSLDDD